jgi:hypothetical protein
MKKIKFFLIAFIMMIAIGVDCAYAQGVGINADGSNPDNSAMLDVKSDSSGFLSPRLSLGNNGIFIGGPAPHLFVTNLNTAFNAGSRFNSGVGYYRNAGTKSTPKWNRLLESSDSTMFWGTRGNAGTNQANDFIGTTDNTDFIIKTGVGGTLATRRRITVPYGVSTGEIVMENVRALQVPRGSFGSPSLRLGTSPSIGFYAEDLGGTNIGISYGTAVSASYRFGTGGMTIAYGGITPNVPQTNTRLDVNGNIYTRGRLVYGESHASISSQERTAKVERYWTASISSGPSGAFFEEVVQVSGVIKIRFQLVRTGGDYVIQASKFGPGAEDYTCNGFLSSIPAGTGTNWGGWRTISDTFTYTSSVHNFIATTYRSSGGQDTQPLYKFTIMFNGNSQESIKVITEAYYNH